MTNLLRIMVSDNNLKLAKEKGVWKQYKVQRLQSSENRQSKGIERQAG